MTKCSRYQLGRGYWWEFGEEGTGKAAEEKTDDEGGWDSRTSRYQRTRVDGLLAALAKEFPPNAPGSAITSSSPFRLKKILDPSDSVLASPSSSAKLNCATF